MVCRAGDQGGRERDERLKQGFEERGLVAEGLKGNLLFEPWEVRTAANGDFKVFTAFWRACRSLPSPGEPLPAPKNLRPPERWPESDKVADWKLLPTAPDWAGGLRATWTPGEAAARQRLEHFLDDALPRYREARDLPAETGTSRLSPHLAFGEVSPRRIWHAAMLRGPSAATDKFLSEIGWREFSYSLLFHHGNLAARNFRPEFDAFPWADEEPVIEAWRRGRTGYPIVDAGMRQMLATGWMHNRVRMIVASFLVKDLHLPWQWGAKFFMQHLVDGDLGHGTPRVVHQVLEAATHGSVLPPMGSPVPEPAPARSSRSISEKSASTSRERARACMAATTAVNPCRKSAPVPHARCE